MHDQRHIALALLAALAAAPALAGWITIRDDGLTPGATALRLGCMAPGQYERPSVPLARIVTIEGLPDSGRCYFALNAGPQDEWFFDFTTLSGGRALPGAVRNLDVTSAPTPPTPPPANITVTLNANDPQNPDQVKVAITGTGPVTLTLAGGQAWDWLKVGANAQGAGGTVVPTTPAIGGNNDGVSSASIVVTAPTPAGAVADTDPGSAFPGAGSVSATVAGVTKPLVKIGTTYSVSF